MDHSEEGNKHPESGKENMSSHLSYTSTLKEGWLEEHCRADSFLPLTSSSFRGDWSQRPSPTMSLPCKGWNLPSVMPGDRETGAGTCGDIMKPGTGSGVTHVLGRSLGSGRNSRRMSTL